MILKRILTVFLAAFGRVSSSYMPERIIKNYHTSKNRTFFSLSFFLSLFIFLYTFISFFIFDNWAKNHYQKDVRDIIGEPKCSPFKTGATQYSVVIDGQRYPKFVHLHKNVSIDFKCLNSRKEMKKILAWSSFFNDPGLAYGLHSNNGFKDRRCPVDKCILFDDKEFINHADLVIAHMMDHVEPIPLERAPSTRLLFMLYESPMHSSDMEIYNNVFNFTSTYKLDGDFPGFYDGQADMIWKLNKTFNESFDFSQGRTKMAAMVVSNCQASNKRLEYAKEVQKYMKVDIFGNCGRPCPIINEQDDCKKIIGDKYKFYFAFENSNCDGYITEKFFTVLKYNIIPVVYGGGNYEDYIPKSGFINAFDFKGPKELAEYLKYLDKNAMAYNSYFKWKKHVSFGVSVFPDFTTICDMCIHLLLEDYIGIEGKTIHDIGSYWSREKNCNKISEYDFNLQQ